MANKNRTKEQLLKEIKTLSRQIAILKKAEDGRRQAERTLRRQNAYLIALHQTTIGLMQRMKLSDLLKTIVEHAGTIVGTRDGYIYLISPTGKEMELLVGLGIHKKHIGYRLKRGQGLGGKVWKTGKPLMVPDYNTWAGRVADRRFDDIHCAIGIPLKSGSKVIGVIALSFKEDRKIDADEISILNQFANLATIALDNAGLYAAMQQELDERKKIEKSLQIEKAYLEHLFENAPEAIVLFGGDGQIIRMNSEFTRVFGFTLDDFLNDSFDRLIAPEHLYQEAASFTRRTLKGELVAFESVRRRKDGTPIHVSILSTPIKMSSDQVAVYAIYRDITARKKAEEELRRLKEFNEEIVQTMSEGIVMQDAQGYLIFVNPAAAAMQQFLPEELLGTHWTESVPPDQHPIILAADERRKQGESDRYETQLLCKDGRRLSVLISGRPRHENGQFTGTLSVFTDITDRKKAEEALKESEEKYRLLYDESKRAEEVYRSLIHSSADAIIVYDLNGKFTYVSPSFTDIFGWNLEEVIGKPIPFVPEPEKDSSLNRITSLIINGTPCHSFETKRLTKDNRLLDVSLSASRFYDHAGQPAGMLMILRDITQTRKLQTQLQHAQKMESIGTIASGVAHNFRNILAGVSLQNQLIKVRFRDNLPLLEITDMIANGVKRGARLVDGLMQFSRKQGAKDFSIVNITQVITDVYDLARKSFDNKIDIRVNLPEYLPIIGNHADIGQVILNLCVNARDAMPDGGVLHIKAHQKREKVEIIITDTGHGMDKATVAKCFDPFFTTKDVGKGTGLGLSTSYGIIHDHGGDIHVYSEPGKGTAFKIRLPLSSLEDITIQENFPETTVQGKGQKVLVVDDETQILKPLEELLEFLGYQADSETCGTDAIAKYKTWLPDVVLLDRNMPEMDGIACAETIIRQFPKATIVLISGYNEMGANGIKPETKKLIAGYLTKPIDMIELSQLLSKLLDQK